jgi:hypothetical protein
MNKIFAFIVSFAMFVGMSPAAFAYIPNDPLLKDQWYLNTISAFEAWDQTFGGKPVTVAVIDTGIDTDHPDINFWRNSAEIAGDGFDNDNNGYVDDVHGWNFIDDNNDVTPDTEDLNDDNADILHHGTIVSGLIAGIPNNNEGIAGVSWTAEIMPIKIARSSGVTSTGIMSNAVRYAVDSGAEVINISLVSLDGVLDQGFQDAVEYAYDNDVVVVAAAGNGAQGLGNGGLNLNNEPAYPVCFVGGEGQRTVLGVGATNRKDDKAGFSNYGKNCVEVSAPGVDIVSTQVFDADITNAQEYYSQGWFGTSFAAPLVSGAAAYVRSVSPDLTVQEVMDVIKTNGSSLTVSDAKWANQLGTRLDLSRVISATLAVNGQEGESGTQVEQNNDVKEDTVIEVQDAQKQTIVFGSVLPSHYLLAPMKGAEPQITTLDSSFQKLASFYAFNKWEVNGVSVDYVAHRTGLERIVAGAGPGYKPVVRIFNDGGLMLREFNAYAETFQGGVNVVAGDVLGDGHDEIIVAPMSAGGPHIRIFDLKTGTLKSQFFAHDTSYRGGLQIAVGNVLGDQKNEIIVALEGGERPLVKIFNSQGELQREFMAYAENFRKGFDLEVGNIDANSYDEIIVAAKQGGGPHVRMFDGQGSLQQQFFAYETSDRNGVLIDLADVNKDGQVDVIAHQQVNHGNMVKAFTPQGNLISEYSLADRNIGESFGLVPFLVY